MKTLLLIDEPKETNILSNGPVEFFAPWAKPFKGIDQLTPPSFGPYPNPEELYKTFLKTINSAQYLADVLSDVVPSTLGISEYPKSFWKYFFCRYVILTAGFVEDTMKRLKSLPEDDYVLGRPVNTEISCPATIEVFLDTIDDPDFRRAIIDVCLKSEFSEHKRIDYYSRRGIRLRSKKRKLYPFLRGMYYFAKGCAGNIISSFVPSHGIAMGLVRHSFYDVLFYSYSGIFVPAERLFQKKIPDFEPDWDLREKITENLSPPFKEIVKFTLPLTDLEGLRDVLKISKTIVERFPENGKRLYVNPRAFTNRVLSRMAVCLLSHAGYEVVSIQHGGACHYQAQPGLIFTEGIVADAVATWGWKEWDERPKIKTNKVIPMPSIYLYRLRKSMVNKKKKWKALLAVYTEGRYPKWIYDPIWPDMAFDYFSRQKVLFNYFNQLKPSAVKLYHDDDGWEQDKWIKENFKNLTILSSGKFVKYADEAQICIVDYCSTVFVEMLARNKPFICTWSRKWFSSTPGFEQDLDKLSNVGIFYADPEDLVKQFSLIGNDIEGWWNEPERKKIVSELARKDAYCPDDTRKQWRKEFCRP